MITREEPNRYRCHIVGGIGPNEEKKANWCGEIDFSEYISSQSFIRVMVGGTNDIRENNETNNECHFYYYRNPIQRKQPYNNACTIRGPHEPPLE